MPESNKNRCNAFRLTMIFDGIFDGTKSVYVVNRIYKSIAYADYSTPVSPPNHNTNKSDNVLKPACFLALRVFCCPVVSDWLH